MLKKGMSKQEISKYLEGKGDFVKIDHLKRFLRQTPPIEIKKFVLLKLAEIYGNKSMFIDSAITFETLSSVSVTFSDKIKCHVKEAEMYIKAGIFESVDYAMKKAFSHANASQKYEIYLNIKNSYKKQAESYEKEKKRNHAARIYENLLEMKISDSEKEEIREKLLKLYRELGKSRKIL